MILAGGQVDKLEFQLNSELRFPELPFRLHSVLNLLSSVLLHQSIDQDTQIPDSHHDGISSDMAFHQSICTY